ncbi:OmpA family protein [Tenacibaculum finnmarkense genomovar ulcerans]|uniref:OmpA family protein n=1 Tax=Tenacibaculum finnmarkense TaxID=2781243 RepID=UPI00187B246A|nr:OmpA family protein [Tenacibaculum finnmarkense]MBE7687983.1 OmpA family protein [Tenacibaculum finnmarkense genomovar ulcerans]
MNKQIIYTIILFLCPITLVAQKTTITHKVYFNIDSDKIKTTEKKKLLNFIEANKQKIKHITFIGYCDDNASSNYNLILSKKRATNTKKISLEYFSKNLPFNLKYKGELDILKNTSSANKQRKENRRVDIICKLITKKSLLKNKTVLKPITKVKKNKPKILRYNDFVNLSENILYDKDKKEKEFKIKQKALDSISRIVTAEEVKDFEKLFFNTKIKRALDTKIRYTLDDRDTWKRVIAIRPTSRKMLYLLSKLMLKFPKLKIKLFAYNYGGNMPNSVRNIHVIKYYKQANKKKIKLAITYLVANGINKNRIAVKTTYKKKWSFSTANHNRKPTVCEIIKLN